MGYHCAMPSWNIHMAHAQRLLEREGSAALGIRDEAAFLFGNVLPDVYVGFVVPDVSRRVPYHDTHLAQRHQIPLPDYDLFWRRHVEPRDQASDVTLGAWCHLACDNVYNSLARKVAAEAGIKPGEELRVRKQADYELFGRTLTATLRLEATPEVVAQAAAFPQYGVDEVDVHAAVRAGNELLEASEAGHIEGTPAYDLFRAEQFDEAFEAAHRLMADTLAHAHSDAHF